MTYELNRLIIKDFNIWKLEKFKYPDTSRHLIQNAISNNCELDIDDSFIDGDGNYAFFIDLTTW